MKFLKKKILGVKVQGWLTVTLVLVLASMMGVVPNAVVVPVSKQANWVMFYTEEMDHWQLNSGVAKKDFKNQGWNVIKTVGVGEKSDAKSGWNKFIGEYGTNPAICLLSEATTPFYSDGLYYWSWYVITNQETAGKVYVDSYDKHNYEIFIIGNAKKYDADDYNLVKFVVDRGRTIIIVWTGIRFDTGQLQGYVLAWRWVAVYGAYHEKNWYILDNRGNIIDSEIIPSDPAEQNGENPEENPLLNPDTTDPVTDETNDYTDPDDPIPNVEVEDPAVVVAREQQAILVMVGLIGILLALAGGTLYLGKKMKLF